MGLFGQKDTKPKKTKEEIQKEKEDAIRDKEEEKKAAEEKQVELAYRFLMQPDVQKASDIQKRNFLRKKGLTHEQIDLAFKRRDDKKDEKPAVNVAQTPSAIVQDPATQPSVRLDSYEVGSTEESQKATAVVEEDLDAKLERAFKNGFLSLKNSKITELDSRIFQIQNLKTLIASQNLLITIPDSISQLIELYLLGGNLVNLRILQLAECGLTDDRISSNLFALPNLVELNLAKNKLHHISLIVNLPVLSRLDVSDNDIVELPEDIEKCQKLQALNIKNNHISFFPHQFNQLSNLKRLIISGNGFESEAFSSLQEGGIEGLFKYLSSH